jgi:hypothetical protein
LFYDNGFRGNSVNPLLQSGETWIPFSTTAHDITEGNMFMEYTFSKGWICKDPGCHYFITYGRYYTES